MSSFSCTDLAYLAGILDADGTLRIKKVRRSGRARSPTYRIDVQVGNTSRQLIDWLLDRFGGNAHSRRFPGRWRKMWYWSLNRRGAEQVLEGVRPYLTIKRANAEELLAFMRGGEFGPVPKIGARGFAVVTEIELARREGHYQQTRQLNQRGQPA